MSLRSKLVKFYQGTQSEYDQLSSKDPYTLYATSDTNILYKGDDALSSILWVDQVPEVLDAVEKVIYAVKSESTVNLYSKINNEMIKITNSVDDESISNDKSWSSLKINLELLKKQDLLIAGNNISIDENNVISSNQIDDNIISSTKTWSSSKINDKLISVYRFKGSVDTYNDLPTEDVITGDVYNVIDTDMNYAAIVDEDSIITWDKLGSEGLRISLENSTGEYSVKQSRATVANGSDSVALGKSTSAVGSQSFTTGDTTLASGSQSVAVGRNTKAIGESSYAEGINTTADGEGAHSSGRDTLAKGNYSATFGNTTVAEGKGAIAAGVVTVASADYSIAVGIGNDPQPDDLFEIGNGSVLDAQGNILPEESRTKSNAFRVTKDGRAIAETDVELEDGTKLSDREGVINKVISIGDNPTDTEYPSAKAVKDYVDAAASPIIFETGSASGSIQIPENTHATGMKSMAIGNNTTASSSYAFAEGNTTKARGESSHAEGSDTDAYGYASHAEGSQTHANNNQSHAEGQGTYANGSRSHAEGEQTTASGDHSHAEGMKSNAVGEASHAEGYSCVANGGYSHSGGYESTAIYPYSFAHGNGIQVLNGAAVGNYNVPNPNDLFQVGNGSSSTSRSNAFRVTNNGTAVAKKFELEDGTPIGGGSYTAGNGIEISAENVISMSQNVESRLTSIENTIGVVDQLIGSGVVE